MSALLRIKLSRSDSSVPWGFRLEGGLDLGHALNIQKVTPGSVAEACGVKPGDIIVSINSADTRFMKHEDAKMEIIRSNNAFEMIVERNDGGNSMAVGASITLDQVSTTSEVSTQPTDINGGVEVMCGVPKAGTAMISQGPDGRFQRLSHSSYNSPMGLYSKSNVNTSFRSTVASAGADPSKIQPAPQIFGGSMRCGSCQELITGGQFVRVQGRIPMHPSCLKCCKCGIGLRNVGYFYINEMLYCETHAKQVGRPPDSNVKPVVIYK
ncbi:PDZ and LIM domain protein 3 [Echinococcus granulosus]|uniref:PDZ and LIM domain protein n=1 Tax=Echinococcus granulosus TaxID=6210 RepID=U6J9Z5_ECHGR|nr:PDZ and LIM domain protein [Echinococcus granulosus]EUB62403.1 PDZ and LIM domain protein [Echinococcus granulosus]KAH9281320.1 PDZ and LIM domain protein 3 [Echinococcus granulosus]CDS18553.1 PDZ and LIM domain protein Zasp [Echinococcus granulosus]